MDSSLDFTHDVVTGHEITRPVEDFKIGNTGVADGGPDFHSLLSKTHALNGLTDEVFEDLTEIGERGEFIKMAKAKIGVRTSVEDINVV